jgi:hypothetical protein
VLSTADLHKHPAGSGSLFGNLQIPFFSLQAVIPWKFLSNPAE